MSQLTEGAKKRMEKACEKHGDEYQVRETEEFTGNAVFRFKDLDSSFCTGYQAGMQDPEANADIIAERETVIQYHLNHIKKLEVQIDLFLESGKKKNALLDELEEFLRNAPLMSGVCCCGMEMKDHGFQHGHSAVDSGEYAIGQMLEKIREARK